MRCPKCGCKMQKQVICPYCKITGDQVRFASNREAKKKIKDKDTTDVLMSHTMPYDIDRGKMLLITIFGGFFGIDSYYIGRYIKATIHASVITLTFLIVVLRIIYPTIAVIKTLMELITIVAACFTASWLSNIIRVCFKSGTYPIILPTAEQLQYRVKRHEEMMAEKQQRKVDRETKKAEKRYEKEMKKANKTNSKTEQSATDNNDHSDTK